MKCQLTVWSVFYRGRASIEPRDQSGLGDVLGHGQVDARRSDGGVLQLPAVQLRDAHHRADRVPHVLPRQDGALHARVVQQDRRRHDGVVAHHHRTDQRQGGGRRHVPLLQSLLQGKQIQIVVENFD
jgi:hypothetical protein